MSYSDFNRAYIFFPSFDAGAGAGSFYYRLPEGVSARLVDYGMQDMSEAAAGDLNPTISVGTAADVDAYGEEFSIAGVIDDGYTVLSENIRQEAIDLIIVQPEIPAGSLIRVTFVAATGGTAAGIGLPYLVIDLSRF